MSQKDTHYIGFFTQQNKLLLQAAVCGRFIRGQDHSTEPTCGRCQAYLLNERMTPEEMFGTGENDRPDPIRPDPDPVKEYEARMDYKDRTRSGTIRRWRP